MAGVSPWPVGGVGLKNIVLIGFMGTGKTVIGRHLARVLRRRFVDTDDEIEGLAGKTVAQIFREDGEAHFRAEESRLCRGLAAPQGLVVATGGGMVVNPENVAHLRRGGVLIGLTAAPEVILDRVSRKDTRPLLRGSDKWARIEKLLRKRAGVYDVAEFTVDTGTASPERTVRSIVAYLGEQDLI